MCMLSPFPLFIGVIFDERLSEASNKSALILFEWAF